MPIFARPHSRHSFPFPLMRRPSPPLSTLCDLMKLPISATPPRFPANPPRFPSSSRLTHSLTDPVTFTHSPRSHATRSYTTSVAAHGAPHSVGHGQGGKQSLCGQEGDGGRGDRYTAEIAGKIHKRSTPNSDTNPYIHVSGAA